MRRPAAFFPIALALGAIIFVLACSGAVSAQAQETRNTRFPTPFEHIVVIFQENRTPDNLFQGLCAPPFGTRASCSTTPTARQYAIQVDDWLDKTSPTGVTSPETVPLANQYDLSHAHTAFVAQCDLDPATGQCQMDGAA